MYNVYSLSAVKDGMTLQSGIKDCITKEPLKAGDRIIVCKQCKLAGIYLEKNWSGSCAYCGETDTMQFPSGIDSLINNHLVTSIDDKDSKHKTKSIDDLIDEAVINALKFDYSTGYEKTTTLSNEKAVKSHNKNVTPNFVDQNKASTAPSSNSTMNKNVEKNHYNSTVNSFNRSKYIIGIISLIIILLIIILSFSIFNHHEENSNNISGIQNNNVLSSANEEPETVSANTQASTLDKKPQYVDLGDLMASESDGYYTNETSAMDSVGNKYSKNFVTLGTTGVLGDGTSYAAFHLGGKYKTLTGKLAVNNSSWDEHTASFAIYADENEIYNTGEVSKIFAPTNLSVNIENCQWLKIKVTNYAENANYGGENINFILSEFRVHENEVVEVQTEDLVNLADDISLKEMVAAESDGYYSDETSVMDSVGNKYTGNVISLGSTGVLGNGTSYAVFYLGGNYKSLTGKLAVNNSSWNEYTASFSVYADDNEIYNTGEVSKKFVPIDLLVNIENCQWLMLKVTNFASSGGENINFILSDFIIHKNEVNVTSTYKKETNTATSDSYLKNLVASEFDDYYNDTNSAKDSHGNAYDNHVITIGAVGVLENGTSYATYYLGNKYKSLTGKIAVNSTSWENKVASLIIYSDDAEIFNTGDIGKDYNPFDVDINIDGCEWLKIVVDNNDGEFGENINFILSEMRLHS